MDPVPAPPLDAKPSNMPWWMISLLCVSMVSTFFGGYFVHGLIGAGTELKPKREVIPEVKVSPTPTLSNGESESSTMFLPGKQYLDDTVMAITETIPRQILIGTVSRLEGDVGVTQATRVSFFDGSVWTRKTLSKSYETLAIYPDDLVAAWKVEIDPSRVLKQTVTGKIKIEGKNLEFDTGILTNNIGMRSLPGYTKFMSTGEGSLMINGVRHQAKILYTQIYSANSKDIQFYDTPLGLTTHWLAFWDNNGNFYHLDSTQVERPTPVYQTHEIGVKVDSLGRVSKTFEAEVVSSSENPPLTYQIKLGAPINQTLNFSSQTSINKAPNNAYDWFMSEGVGNVEGAEGYGAVEYIHN